MRFHRLKAPWVAIVKGGIVYRVQVGVIGREENVDPFGPVDRQCRQPGKIQCKSMQMCSSVQGAQVAVLLGAQ